MQLKFTIRGLMDFTALVATTLAVDAYCWKRLVGGPSPPWVMRESISWILVAWGALSGVYLAWRLTSRRRLWFVPASVITAGGITLANTLAVIVLPFGVPEPRYWYFYSAIVALVPMAYASIASLILSVGVALSICIRDQVFKDAKRNVGTSI